MNDESLTEVTEHLKDTNVWLRLLYMLLFWIIYCVAEVVLGAVVLFQFLIVLFTGSKNDKLLTFGGQLSTFIYQVLRFLTFNSESRPYPFDEWPAAETAEVKQGSPKAEAPAETVAEAETPAEKPKPAPKPAAKKTAPKKPAAKKPAEEKGATPDAEEEKK